MDQVKPYSDEIYPPAINMKFHTFPLLKLKKWVNINTSKRLPSEDGLHAIGFSTLNFQTYWF